MNRSIPLLVVAAAVLAACGGPGPTPRAAPDDQPDYRIEIRNQNFSGVNVYIYRDGFRHRIGTVDGITTRTLTFDWSYPDVRILLDFIGGGCIRTDTMGVVQGDDLLLIVQAGDHRRASRSLC